VRTEEPDAEVEEWLAKDGAPVVYVSLGSFLSVRSDVLARVAQALRGLDVRVALASGSTAPEDLGPIPHTWLVRAELPQVTVLRQASLAVSHGGNNSVTESLTAGVPMLLLPLSTDQFAGAAALEAAGLGEALDPNGASPQQLQASVRDLLAPERRRRLDRLSADLKRAPGAVRARRALVPAAADPTP
jgi:MGT family glycosyltransferase